MYEIQLEERIMGYSTTTARGGETATIQVSGATSTEDGDLHLKYLEGFPQTVLSMIEDVIHPSEIKSMIVIISNDLKARVYINEVEIHAYAFVKANKVEKGQGVTKDDISGFERIKLGDIDFPEDHAYFCVLSFGWDRAYIFDFSPLNNQENKKIEYDIEKYIGSYYSYLSFKTIHKISDSDWLKLFEQNWFPFFSLKFSTVESMINYSRSGWNIDELLEKIEIEAIKYIDERMSNWDENNDLSPFVDFLKIAMERHKANDFVSAASIIYPKIEGLIRQSFIKDNPDKQGRKQNILIEHITDKTINNLSALTTYIPDKFKGYLEKCYFKDFTVTTSDNQVSRHSVAHGASSIDKYGKKESLLGLLVFSQISQYLQQSYIKS